ncbi:MAG: PqqD family protein [Verrucomicrobia bacterium]|jgi:Coenzyme PQQ synthesis protein D (PqqD)|nr:PqqD family protein [Verrucomicrobiota bacterium]
MSDQLSRLALSDEGFVFNPQTGDSFQVSETGIVVIRLLKEGRSDEEIAARLTDLYEVSLEEAQHDCADFRARLKQFELA